MQSLRILFVVASGLGIVSPALLQEALPGPPPEKTIEEYFFWKARHEFAAVIPKQWLISQSSDQPLFKEWKNFHENVAAQHKNAMEKEWPDLKSLRDVEETELYKYTDAYDEFVQLVMAIRDYKANNMKDFKKRQVELAKRPVPPAPRRTPLTIDEALRSNLKASVSRAGKESRDENEQSKWRLEVDGRARAARDAKVTDQKLKTLYADASQILEGASKKFESARIRLGPPIAADEFVSKYVADSLITNATRIEVSGAAAITLNERRKPDDIRVVVYDVTDAFGMKRRGSVAVYKNANNEWVPSNDNKAKGGFHEMRSTQENQ